MTRPGCFVLLLLFLSWGARALAGEPQIADWPWTEGAPGGGRYSPLVQIDRSNVSQLRLAWEYHHGDQREATLRPDRINRSTSFEATPIVVDGRLLFSTPFDRVIALDPETGRELWSFDPAIDKDRFFANMLISRGVAYWRGPQGAAACSARVFLATLDARLIALDAATGLRCADFGREGEVDLLAGLTAVADPWEYNLTSPPTVVGDVVVVGSSIADIVRRIAPPGDVRAFDAKSGRLLWTFHTIPHPGEFGNETWERESWKESGAANVWTTITADLEQGQLFLPVSSPSPDFYGGDRPGANLFGDALVALDARTGRRIWHFQTVHHDIWDYDLPAPPVLLQVRRAGRLIDAVAQVTKTGFVFLLDRRTGEPLFPVEERPFPASDVPGERAWPTQPIPSRPPPLVSQHLREEDVWDADPEHHEACLGFLRSLRNEGIYTPPSLQGTLIHPSNSGGANWSGAGFDPASGRLFVPVNNTAHVVKLTAAWWAESNLDNGSSQPMHGYLRALWFLISGRGTGLRYNPHPINGRVNFARDGKPCNKPPWGEIVAVDLERGEIAWHAPTGTSEDGVRGLSGYGPLLVTAGGLIFHGGNRLSELRVHDLNDGALVASFALPAGLHAGPITYKLRPEGKQYLVVAPGGHVGIGSTPGDSILAYTLP